MTKLQEAVELLWAELHGYPLSDWVADQRDAGKSWRTIATAFEREVGLSLTDVTLIAWFGSTQEPAA